MFTDDLLQYFNCGVADIPPCAGQSGITQLLINQGSSFCRTRYKWYTDWLNPTYWRRHRDPNYDSPLWNNWRPWQLDRSNIKRAIDMYRNGTIDFKTLDDKWITPSAFARYGKDWADVYLPAARYGAHRYFYSFA
ncbi:unnamed protein product [Cylicostephanus goldi]|uniref:Uncharacterized protein n=1 Tax=Cylicostephanus goldi TaxID=71465 RepID=A0A3P6RCB2_CYLGO|nr:unnamed protein product [Cylicostephanus goldi]